MGFRALNYLDSIASRLGKTQPRLAIIDRALANAGLRRKGTGRSTPTPTFDEEILLLLAATTGASPLSWAEDRPEPKVKEGAIEAQIWASVPYVDQGGTVFQSVARRTLGGTLKAIVSEISKGGFTQRDSLRLELNLTTTTAIVELVDQKGEYLLFQQQNTGKVVDAETLVQIRGRYLVKIALQSESQVSAPEKAEM